MKNTNLIISQVKQHTDSVILFHSASGKDSIAMLHMLYPHFAKVVCVFMYMVKDLSFVEKYIAYAKIAYPNIEFIQVPHYAIGSYIKYGNFGIAPNEKQRKYNLSDIIKFVKVNTGIEWVILGFKKSDGLNRRLMLKTYELDGFSFEYRKAFQLSGWTNKDVLRYIEINRLIEPLKTSNRPSQDVDINDMQFLSWVKTNYPTDLLKIFKAFPESETKLYMYEQGNKAV